MLYEDRGLPRQLRPRDQGTSEYHRACLAAVRPADRLRDGQLRKAAERKAQLTRVTAHLPNVSVDSHDGLLADYAQSHGCCTIIKGLRAGSDFEKEFQMAMINRKLNPKLDSLFLTAEHQYMYLSSSAVKEMGFYQADLSDFLPAEIMDEFREKMKIITNHHKEEQT